MSFFHFLSFFFDFTHEWNRVWSIFQSIFKFRPVSGAHLNVNDFTPLANHSPYFHSILSPPPPPTPHKWIIRKNGKKSHLSLFLLSFYLSLTSYIFNWHKIPKNAPLRMECCFFNGSIDSSHVKTIFVSVKKEGWDFFLQF